MRTAVFTLAAAALLSGCNSQQEGGNADDFAARVEGGNPQGTGPKRADMPHVATNAKQALRTDTAYTQKGLDGKPNSLKISPDGTFILTEGGRTQSGRWKWLPDGKRLRLEGVTYGPVVLVANGALYRMQNEDVPLDDVTPDRMFSLGGTGPK